MTLDERDEGILFVISAPSGTGKSSVARRLTEVDPQLDFSVSFTTRPPRPGEDDGTDYNFVSAEQFDSMLERRGMLEWARVFGNLYGTGLDATRRALARGRDLLLDIDVQGARQVRQGPIAAISVMILPPDYATLESRLRGRGSEPQTEQRARLGQARGEVEEYEGFDYVVVNEALDRTIEEVGFIIRAERRRTPRCHRQVKRILSTFPSRG